VAGTGFSFGGDISLTAGGGATQSDGGNITLTAGIGGTTFGTGGAVSLTAGAGGGATFAGGAVTIAAGAGNTTGAGGNVNITAGTSPSGTAGNVGFATSGGYAHQRGGNFSVAGDAQTNMYVLRSVTTTAAITELFLDGTGGTRRMVVPTDGTWRFEIHIVARRTDADNESAAYEIKGCIDNNAGTTAIVGAVSTNVTAEDTAAWDVLVDADNVNDALRIQVTGEAAKTIRWVAFVRTVEVTG
jgi:hypothetical protein